MSGTIYLVRNGETKWNRAGRMQGHRDSPLTEIGKRQATRIGDWLQVAIENRDGLALVASRLGGSRHTAEIILRRLTTTTRRLTFDDRLKEMTWGRWDGLTLAEIEARDGELSDGGRRSLEHSTACRRELRDGGLPCGGVSCRRT